MTRLGDALAKAKVNNLLYLALVAWISASQELREVWSCLLPSQPMGPPFLKMMPPFIRLQKLKERKESTTGDLRIFDPRHTLLQAGNVEEFVIVSGIAFSYNSTSAQGG